MKIISQHLIKVASYLKLAGRERDLENSQLISDVLEDIKNWFKKNKENWQEYFTYTQGGYITELNRMSSKIPTELFLILVRKDSPTRWGAGFGKLHGKPVIVLKVLDYRMLHGNPHLPEWITVGKTRDLKHELAHYFNSLKRGEAKSPNLDSLEEYYNHPEEINSYYQEAVSDITSIIHNHQTAREKLLESFETFKKAVYNSFDDTFLEYLNEKNKKRLLSRVFQLYQNLRDKNYN